MRMQSKFDQTERLESTCPNCGHIFFARRDNQKFCQSQCAIDFHARRRRLGLRLLKAAEAAEAAERAGEPPGAER